MFPLSQLIPDLTHPILCPLTNKQTENKNKINNSIKQEKTKDHTKMKIKTKNAQIKILQKTLSSFCVEHILSALDLPWMWLI